MSMKDKLNQIAEEVIRRMKQKPIMKESDREDESEMQPKIEGEIEMSFEEEAPKKKGGKK